MAASGGGPWRIALVSFVVLTLELSFLRQIPAEVKAISYFTNLILMASFFGLGLGCILSERRLPGWLLPVGVLLTFAFLLSFRGIVLYSETQSVHYWLEHDQVAGQARRVPLLLAALLAFAFTSVSFVALGHALAREMDRFGRLVAYSWDIAGSLAGTAFFSASALLGTPPWAWVALSMLLWAAVFCRGLPSKALHALAGASFIVFAWTSHAWHWSPYYFVQYELQPFGIDVYVNSSYHQTGLDFTSASPHLAAVKEEMIPKWGQPYELYRKLHDGRDPERVLVLGAGTGNDVHVAREYGARQVVAVEIDPVILALGREHNRTQPYADPSVRAIVDDARHFLHTSEERFDMIVFGTLDSQALLSGHANLRLENYVYTVESLQDVRRLLADGGILAVYYSVYKPWLANRLYATVREVFGDQSMLRPQQSQTLFNTLLVAVKDVPGFADDPAMVARHGHGIPSTDDWPFIYLERPFLPGLYGQLLVLVVLLVAGVFVLLRRLHPGSGLRANFLFLGLGFTLMESSAVVRMALLYGSTWVVNAVVFAAVLSTIFIANLLVLRGRAPSLRVAWMGLLASVLVNYAFPVQQLFEIPLPWRTLAVGALLGLPVLCAAVCFSHLFAREQRTGFALGVNLVGAMAGGVLEYASMVVGMRSVWLIVLAVYALAWIASWPARARSEAHGSGAAA